MAMYILHLKHFFKEMITLLVLRRRLIQRLRNFEQRKLYSPQSLLNYTHLPFEYVFVAT